jgi:FdhE protein
MTVTDWIQAHPFLAQIAGLEARLDAALAPAPAASIAAPALDAHAAEHAAGVPLLHATATRVDLAPAAALLRRLVAALSGEGVPAALAAEAGELSDELSQPGAAEAVVLWAARGEGTPPRHAGLARYLAWVALARVLAPVRDGYAAWKKAEEWRRPECPTCGALPMLAALVPEGAGRARLLACGQCRTRWTWTRIGCPHCGNDAQEGVELLELEGDAGLRLDTCRVCHGYVKTVTREPLEAFLLADWTTLHLDALAKERGLERRGVSLYVL